MLMMPLTPRRESQMKTIGAKVNPTRLVPKNCNANKATKMPQEMPTTSFETEGRATAMPSTALTTLTA